jgi:hypothetical protein
VSFRQVEMNWRWIGPEAHMNHELITMALDVKLVVDEIRRECLEADIWLAETGSPPEVAPSDFIDGLVKPHFLRFVRRLEELDVPLQSRHLFLAAGELSGAISVRDLPSDFVGEEFQGIYRGTWRAAGHLVLGSGNALSLAPQEERQQLAAAASCVLLDPTSARAWEPSLFSVKDAHKILSQVVRDRDLGARDR